MTLFLNAFFYNSDVWLTLCSSVPFGALAVLGIYTLWPEERRGRYDCRTALSKVDFIGNTLLILASILLVFAVEQGGSFVWEWSSPVIIWSLVISAIAWVLLSVWEAYLFYGHGQRIEPIFPLHLAVGRVYLSCLMCVDPPPYCLCWPLI